MGVKLTITTPKFTQRVKKLIEYINKFDPKIYEETSILDSEVGYWDKKQFKRDTRKGIRTLFNL